MGECDTIVAVATPPGRSALAVIRVSGSGSREILRSCVEGPERVLTADAGHVRLCRIVNRQEGCALLDEVTIVRYDGPRSYTGEDMAEITCHGSPLVVEAIVRAILACGARCAGRGEFTKRAFLNGKVDLLKAEAIRELIECRGEAGRSRAISVYGGGHLSTLERWKRELEDALCVAEARLEFPDEELGGGAAWRARVTEKTAGLKAELREELRRWGVWRTAENGLIVAIVGAKNVGKSSLFNQLVGAERAIVHHSAGTTRDAIAERIAVRGVEVTLVDTAGIGDAQEEVEALGIARTWEHIGGSDIVVWVTVAGGAFSGGEEELWGARKGRPTIGVVNKADLVSGDEKGGLFSRRGIPWAATCLKRTRGDAGRVWRLVEEAVVRLGGTPQEGILLNARHEASAKAMLGHLEAIAEDEGLGEELVAFELTEALKCIEEFLGRVSSEEVLERVFSEFCIGK